MIADALEPTYSGRTLQTELERGAAQGVKRLIGTDGWMKDRELRR